MKYVAVDIGCIECGEESSVLGIFDNKEQAEKILDKCEKFQYEHWVGQHNFEIFEINKENELVDEYYLKNIKEK